VVKRSGRKEKLDISKIHNVLKFTIEPGDLNITVSDLAEVELDAHLQFRDGMTTAEIQQILIRTAAEKVSAEKPDFTYVAARLMLFDLYKRVNRLRGRKLRDTKTNRYKPYDADAFVSAFPRYVQQGYYGRYLLDYYTLDEITMLYRKLIKADRDLLFTYAGLKMLVDRYLVQDERGNVIELPQEMYLLIAMTLAIPDYKYALVYGEQEAKEIMLKQVQMYYDLLSQHKATVATPTLMNARRPFTQLSSCFVLTVDDDLYDMYDNLQKMAQISKYAGGLGVYVGKLRASGSSIQQKKGTSSGVIPYAKLINDTMAYVDQLGMRKGSASVTLDIWHKDILDFLEVKTNVGDERKKAHDIHPAISIPDLFMQRVVDRQKWTLFDPYEVRQYIGYQIEQLLIDRLINYLQENSCKIWNVDRRVLHANAYDKLITVTGKTANTDRVEQLTGNQIASLIADKTDVLIRMHYIHLVDKHFDEAGRFRISFALKYPGLEDFWGKEFEQWYLELEKQSNLSKREVDAFELMKRLITVAFETGEPYIFFRDIANEKNPNRHIGIVYSSNLCHEIVQSMMPSKSIPAPNKQYQQVYENAFIDYGTKNIGWFADSVSAFATKEINPNAVYCADLKEPGLVPVCNLASINLGKVESDDDLRQTLHTLVRILDNVIDLNFYPGYETARTNKLFRAIGIGVSNYHYWLVKNGIKWESEEHVRAADKLFEKIAYYAVEASIHLANERGKYPLFDGSQWSKGILFGKDTEQLMNETRTNGNNLDWKSLVNKVKTIGLRNAYLLALMPTGSTSIIIGATPSIDPIFAKFYKEENMSGILPQVPPEIDKYYWHYKTAYTIDHKWTIRAAAARQKWIDQAQSLNLFVDPQNIDGPTLMSWYIEAWRQGLKTIYYLRSKSIVDIEECESCSA